MIVVNTDGSVKPGLIAGGWVIKDSSGTVISKGASSVSEEQAGPEQLSNNWAEYLGIYEAIRELIYLHLTSESVKIQSDSMLVVKQLKNEISCNHPKLVEYRDKIWILLENFDSDVAFEWVPRAKNQEADDISRSLFNAQ